MGLVAARQSAVDAIIEHWLVRIDTSATPAATLVLFDPERELVIDSISILYDVATSAGAVLAINLGTAATAAALAAITPAISQAAGVHERADGASGNFRLASSGDSYASGDSAGASSITWGTTYPSTVNGRFRGKQVIPRNTPIFMTHAGDSNTGEVTLLICAYPLDTNSLK